jgi:EpsI family protein
MNLWRFALVCALLSGTAVFLSYRDHDEVFAARQDLSALPSQLGTWKGRDMNIPDDVRETLGHGDFLSRIYLDEADSNHYVDLFIAYFPSQRFGDTIHSPKNCLPGSGWYPVDSSRVTLSFPGYRPFPANRYIISKGEDRQVVIYWYLAHDRSVASEYWARYYLLVDSVKMNRSDGSMIRLVTPLGPSETIEAAQQRALSLAGNIVPLIDRYVPR